MTTPGLYSGKRTLALVARSSALTFDLLYGSTKLKYLKQTQTGFRAESFTSHSYGTSSILSFYKTPGKELFKMGMVKPPFLTRCIATGNSEAPVPQNVSDTIPDVAPRIKFKRLDKQARHIMQILDKEAVQEVKENREIAKEIADIKPGYIIQLKVEVPENKRRISTLKGTVIARRNAGLHSTFRLRRHVAGVGVESVFPLYSPNIKELKILEKKKVRKAKLYYIRDHNNTPHHINHIIRTSDLSPPTPSQETSHWKRPSPQCLKLNVDISFTSHLQPTGIGYVMRNDSGFFIAAGTTVEVCRTSEETECLGILIATRWAAVYSDVCTRLVVETDCRAAAVFLAGHQSHIS